MDALGKNAKSFVVVFAAELVILFLGTLFLLLPSAWHIVLSFQRDSFNDGALWQLATGHFMHLNWTHWGMDAAAVVFVGLVNQNSSWRPKLSSLCFIMAGLSFWLWMISDYTNYWGISAALYGWIVVVVVQSSGLELWRKAIIVALVFGKISWDLLGFESLIGVDNLLDARVAIEAHGVGVLFGVIYLLLAFFAKNLNKNRA